MLVTKQYLKENPTHIFVFGDNTIRKGKRGAALLRDEPNTYGFITKKFPNNNISSFYTPEEYIEIYDEEIKKLKKAIENNPDKTYLISQLGAGLANKFFIFERIIEPSIKYMLKPYINVKFLW